MSLGFLPFSFAAEVSRPRPWAAPVRRVPSLDAVRGTAMLFVCLSHFADVYFEPIGHLQRAVRLNEITMIASPAFILVSGMLLGLLYRMHTENFHRIRLHLLDRVLFLLTVAHVLILIAHLPRGNDGALIWWKREVMTDTIALCILVASFGVGLIGARTRIAMGLVLIAASWLVVLEWRPTALGWLMLRDVFAGPHDRNSWDYTVPVLPWLGLYLMSTVLGERMAYYQKRGDLTAFGRLVLRLGLSALTIAAIAKGCYWAARGAGKLPISPTQFDVYIVTSPYERLPPSPVYLLFNGGLAMMLIWAMIAAERHQVATSFLRLTRMLGRNSLFVFILQFYVYFVLVYTTRLAYTPFWPFYFLVSLALIAVCAAAWDRARLNRFITVGLPQMVRAHRAMRATVES